MTKLRLSKVTVRNILGIEEIEFEPGNLTVISGPNNKGKTAVLEAMRSVFNGGNDVTLIRQGADNGEVVLLLSDGTELVEKVNASGRRTLAVKNPNFGASKQPQTVIDKLINRLTLNPIEFLVSNPARQREMLLQAIPMTVTVEQLQDATGIQGFSEADIRNKHALEVIAEQGKRLYDQRTGANRSLKEKQTTATQLQATLPDDPPEGDWISQHSKLTSELQEFDSQTALAIQALRDSLTQEMSEMNEVYLSGAKTIENDAREKIEQIRAEMAADLAEIKSKYHEARDTISAETEQHIEALRSIRVDEHDFLAGRQQHASTMAGMAVKAESARHLLHEMQEGAIGLRAESEALTAALNGLDGLKDELTSTLPIRGLEIKEGELYLDRIKFSRWNTATRVTTAIELAKLSAGNLALVIVDGMEGLDEETFEAFAEHVQKDPDCQYIVTRVTNAKEMTIRNYDEAGEINQEE